MKSPRVRSPRTAAGIRAVDSDPLLAGLRSSAQVALRSFRERTVVVTGGASGIGRAIAVGFALAGARVIILDLDRVKGRKTVAHLRQLSPGCRLLPGDLRDPKAIAAAARLFAGATGASILINNAAMPGRLAPFHELKAEECENVLRASLIGPMELARLAARHLIKRGARGTIVNILAIQALKPVPEYSAYVVSKGGMEALTLAMAVDLAPHGIRVNGIRVGPVITDRYYELMPERLKREVASAPRDEAIAVLDRQAATLVGRMGRPSDIAPVALFLASEESGFLTGSIVNADGGRMISRKVEPLL